MRLLTPEETLKTFETNQKRFTKAPSVVPLLWKENCSVVAVTLEKKVAMVVMLTYCVVAASFSSARKEGNAMESTLVHCCFKEITSTYICLETPSTRCLHCSSQSPPFGNNSLWYKPFLLEIQDSLSIDYCLSLVDSSDDTHRKRSRLVWHESSMSAEPD